jgi:hypothetical protein
LVSLSIPYFPLDANATEPVAYSVYVRFRSNHNLEAVTSKITYYATLT